MGSVESWEALDMAWQVAFRQAWRAFCQGSFPVGAALFGSDGMLIAAGRNRIFDPGEDPLSGSLLAHAEVAVLSRLAAADRHDDVTLFTTLEPCVYCMGAIVLSRVGSVRYAGADTYGGASALPLDLNPQTARYDLRIHGPLEDPFGQFATSLTLVYLLRSGRWKRVVEHARRSDPQLLDLATEMGRLATFRDPTFFGFAPALEDAWPMLE